MASIRELVDGDIESVAANMRTMDQFECVCNGYMPIEALRQGVDTSDWSYVMAGDDNTPLAIFGLSGISDTVGAPWLLGTDEMFRLKRFLVCMSRAVIDSWMLSEYDALVNVVHADNSVHLRWLAHCGFSFCEPVKSGPFNEPFIPFYKTRH